jgi:hypothetical protein
MVLARRALLALIAVCFAGLAVVHVIAPAETARRVGLIAVGVDGLNELRAIYVGVWLATSIIFAMAARKHDDRTLYLVCTLLVAGQGFGRAVSLVLDGMPSAQLLPIFVGEVAGVLLLVLLRPRRSS